MMFASSRPLAPAHRTRRHDALVLRVDAGLALLRRPGLHTGPVVYDPVERRIQLLVPQDSADELPGLLDWLEWGGIPLDLVGRPQFTPREAAVWLRPPGPGHEPGRIDLVRLVSAAATECHRAALRRGPVPAPRRAPRPLTASGVPCTSGAARTAQPFAFS